MGARVSYLDQQDHRYKWIFSVIVLWLKNLQDRQVDLYNPLTRVLASSKSITCYSLRSRLAVVKVLDGMEGRVSCIMTLQLRSRA